MAINTAAKRISTVNILTGMRTILPDGEIAQSDRQAAARTYSGITSGAVTVVSGGDSPGYITLILDDIS